MAAPPTYTIIPPPPLPEFYLSVKPGRDRACSSSSSSATAASPTAKDHAIALAKSKTKDKGVWQSQPTPQPPNQNTLDPATYPDGCLALQWRRPPVPGNATDESPITTKDKIRVTSRTIAIPPPPPGAEDTAPPLAIYHICRICLRPRSAHYHRDHPIPINGVPPPPGICRRCRVKHVEDVSTPVQQVVLQEESNDVKLGLACLVPEEAHIGNKEWKEMRGRKILEEAGRRHWREESESTKAEKVVTYRHIRVREATSVSPRRRVEHASSCACRNTVDPAEASPREMVATNGAVAGVATKVCVSKQSVSGSKVPQLDSAAASNTVQPSSSSSSSSSASHLKAKQTVRATLGDADAVQAGYSEAEIRNFARDEVERYRQAERKLQSHPDAYAHGRMVPTARRISRDKDVEEPVPWRERAKAVSSRGTAQVEAAVKPPPSTRPQVGKYHEERERLEVKETTTVPAARASTQSSSSSSSRSHERLKDREVIIERMIPPIPLSVTGKKSETSKRSPPAKQQDNSAPPKSMITEPRSTTSERTKWARVSDKERPKSTPESDPPVSVKLREVLGVMDDGVSPGDSSRSRSTRVREVWVPAPNMHNVIEVIEEFDIPSGKTASEVRAEADAPDRVVEIWDSIGRAEQPEGRSAVRSGASSRNVQSRQSTSVAKEQRSAASSRRSNVQSPSMAQERRPSTRQSEHECWDDDGVARTASRQSTTKIRHAEFQGEVVPDLSSTSRQQASSMQSRSDRDGHRVAETDLETRSDNGRSRAFDRRWDEMEKRATSSKFVEIPESRAESVRDRVKEPSQPPSSASRSSRGGRPTDGEYIYTKRIIKPVDASAHREQKDDPSSTHYTETDELVRRRRVSSAQGSAPSAPTSEGRRHHRETKARDCDDANHVRFSSKVDISPTPPGSEASSVEFRIIGGSRGSKGHLERGEDLIAEYEQRGRARSRRRRREEDASWYYERHARRQPLHRALSESPSRERIDYVGREAQVDGHGPYRAPEPRTDSYEVQDGSDGARVRVDDDDGGHRAGSSRLSAAFGMEEAAR